VRLLHENPELHGGAAGLSEPVKEKTGQTFFPSAWSSFSVEGCDLCAERAGYRYYIIRGACFPLPVRKYIHYRMEDLC